MSIRVIIITVVAVVIVGLGAMLGLGMFRSHSAAEEPKAEVASAPAAAVSAPGATPAAIATTKPVARPRPTSAPTPVVPVVSADGSIVLSAQGARIIGSQLHLENPALPNLTYWVDPAEYPEWRRWVPNKGKYAVEVTYSCAPNSGGRYRIFAGSASVVANADVTGAWDRYRTVTLPDALVVPNDWCTITMKCEGNPNHALMNLQRIRLLPAK